VPSINPWRLKGHAFLANSKRQRARTYRQRAIDLLSIANTEHSARVRMELRELAAHYEDVARRLETGRALPPMVAA